MGNIITPVLPHDLPENWNDTQYVSPGGTEVGLTEKHGYNYLMKQVNNSQKAINELDAEMEDIDTTLQNKAPAGYGLGGGATKTVETDFNNYIDNGVYICPAGIASIQNAPPKGDYGMLIVSRGSNAIVQDVYAPEWGRGYVFWDHTRRVSTSYDGNADSWSPWEWPEPLMEIGVEYRTTDRINGKAVYKRNINGVIQYHLDGETDWKPYADAVGASESQKYMFMVSSKEAHTIDTQGWYRVCSIDPSPDNYYDGTSFIMSISHAQSGSTAEALQVLVNCNKENPNIIVLGGGSDAYLCYSKVRLTFDQTNTKFNFDIYWNANFQNQEQAPNFIVFLNGRHTHKSHEEIFTAMPLTLIDTLPSTESVIKEHIVKPIGSGNILTDESGVKKSGDTMTGALGVNDGKVVLEGNETGSTIWLKKQAGLSNAGFITQYHDLPITDSLKFGRYKDSMVEGQFTIFHTGNKPSGSYTGNGSAAERTFNVGGICQSIIVFSDKGFVIMRNGGIGKPVSNTEITGFPYEQAHFVEGSLMIATNNTLLNENGVKYWYQVL